MAQWKTPDKGILIGHSITKAWRLPPKSWGQRADLFLGKACYLLPGDILELFVHLKSSQRILMVPRLWAKNTETEELAFLPRIPSLLLATASKVIGSFPLLPCLLLTLRLTSLVRGFHGKWLWEWAAEWYSCLESKLAAPQQMTHRTII